MTFYHNTSSRVSLFLSVIIIASTLALTDPFMVFMPEGIIVPLLVFVLSATCLWVGFIVTEVTEDEREESHRSYSAHVGYSIGVLLLALTLVYQGLHHTLSSAIPAILVAMVLGKVLARLWIGHRS
jgi:hypothetical protein